MRGCRIFPFPHCAHGLLARLPGLVRRAGDGESKGRAVKVAGDPAQPVTQGFLCGKVAKYLDRVYAPERILYPLKRKPGRAKGPLKRGREVESFDRVSWDEALDGIAARLQGDGRALRA